MVVEQFANAKAKTLRALHHGPILVLPNAWDAGSAAVIAQAGAQAIATTSGGMAWSQGYADGEQISRAEMIHAVDRIVRSVDIPVTADVEGGYGAEPHDVELTVLGVLEAGVAGINIEDSMAPGGPLFDVVSQSDRIRAARSAAVGFGVPDLVINVRCDVFLFEIGTSSGRLADVLERGRAYADAGADCLFVPGLIDLEVLKRLVSVSVLPINVMAIAGGPSVSEFASIGIQRVSVGTAVAQTAYAMVRRSAHELLESGSYASLEDAIAFGELNSLFAGSSK